MKCAFCGNEIKPGSVYCEKCGNAAQIVPDYNVLEDEILSQLLEEEDASGKEQNPEKKPADAQTGGKERNTSDGSLMQRIWRNKKTRWACILAVVALVLVVAVVCILQNNYSYQYQAGERCLKSESYEKALKHYQKAMKLDDAQTDPLLGAGICAYELKEYDKAEDWLTDVIKADPDNRDAYLYLIHLYQDTDDYAALQKLKDETDSDDILALFDECMIAGVGFSQKGGTYTDDVELELSSSEGYEIYYTTDGSDPITKGRRYSESILIKDGATTVSAVCKDQEGAYSQVTVEKYKISYERPGYPEVTPASGTFYEPTQITISSKEGDTIYYTWDGTTPTASSPLYTGPIDMPEGNNILSIIVIDKHDLCSDVLKCNYKYLPE